MVSYGGDVKGARGVPPSSGLEDNMDVSSESRGGGTGVVIGGRVIVGGGDVAYEVIHSEAEGYHCGVYFKAPYL